MKTLTDVFRHAAEKYPDSPSFMSRSGHNKPYEGPNWRTLYEMGLDLATGLAELGLNPGDKVALFADNRFEWILTDYAVLMNGAVDVPRATDITDSELEFIAVHSESRFMVVEHEKMLKRALALKEKFPNIERFIVLDKNYKGSEALSLYQVLEDGKVKRASGDKTVTERIAKISEDDLFTMIYTSGTTGQPKGVMLTHKNMVSQLISVNSVIPLVKDDIALSILPVWHVFERVFEYLFVYCGGRTYYTSIRTIGNDLKEVKPTFMGSAPRLWESIYQKILKKVEGGSAIASGLFKTAIFCNHRFNQAKRFFAGTMKQAQKPSLSLTFVQFIRYSLGFLLWVVPATLLGFIPRKLQAATGGCLRATVSGGGALPPHIDHFFNDIGITVLEGYGMTECAPIISVRTFTDPIVGTVGKPIPGTDVEIRDLNKLDKTMGRGVSGVIHVRGPQVMNGYFKNKEETDKVVKDGWLNTGDIGVINFDNTITITGRAKDTIVLFSGENVEPVPIENAILESPYIAQTMVVGQDQKALGALVVVDESAITEWATSTIHKDKSYDALVSEDDVKKLVQSEIRAYVSKDSGFKAFEKVTNFAIISKPFEVDDELTKLFKIKRHVVTKKYGGLIDGLYN